MEEQQFHLEVFEGPLDLLLYLIRKDELDIYNIPIAQITEQYLKYIELMKILDLDIAGEFLAMAATLMHIKSRLLLPPEERGEDEEEEDPRWDLVRQLLEYKQFKGAADSFHELELKQEKSFTRGRVSVDFVPSSELPLEDIDLFELLDAFSQVLDEAEKRRPPEFEPDNFTLEDGRNRVLKRINPRGSILFHLLFEKGESRTRIVVVFLALLELIRQKIIQVIQDGHFGEIMIKRVETART
ncbi:MAG: segregation/condensation protein A [Candidatus Euphemobacter frigidus]|nr:segregation/condensation protein A [Candidatus Euphemobacter frigidus]MDP8276585.1 segregation/condensation protein A [Candidatus Euphemobacter frigidus]